MSNDIKMAPIIHWKSVRTGTVIRWAVKFNDGKLFLNGDMPHLMRSQAEVDEMLVGLPDNPRVEAVRIRIEWEELPPVIDTGWWGG